VEASVARLQGKPDEAKALADEVLALKSPPSDAERLQAYVLRSEVACDAGDADAAARELSQAPAPAAAGGPSLGARYAGARARIDALKQDWPSAADQFDRQADLLRQARRYAPMSRALADAGHAYRAAGRSDAASDRYYRAARSAFGLGATKDAAAWVSESIADADRAGATGVKALAESLAAEISRRKERGS
jgi:hypothetical protein